MLLPSLLQQFRQQEENFLEQDEHCIQLFPLYFVAFRENHSLKKFYLIRGNGTDFSVSRLIQLQCMCHGRCETPGCSRIPGGI